MRIAHVIKRAIDIFGSIIALTILSPAFVAIAALILLGNGPPVLFFERRIGRRDREFTICKFCSMTFEQDESGHYLPDDARLTALGRRLRALSLDELPQLWNVLRGDMSLVGPRPLPVRYLSRYTSTERRRHAVRPGMTGWAQVNGRNSLTWGQKFELDIWYVDHWGLGLDLEIFWLTLIKVLRRTGISQDGCSTMPEFLGSTSMSAEKK